MAGMSLLRSVVAMASRLQYVPRWGLRSGVLLRRGPPAPAAPVRFSSGEKKYFVIAPSHYHDKKFRDYLKFYILIGAVPAGIVISLINLFIGPAELAEIPEGYAPEDYEYHQLPISRFIVRTILPPEDASYEKAIALRVYENEKRHLRLNEDIARAAMRQRGDGPWYFYETLDKNLINHEHKSAPDL